MLKSKEALRKNLLRVKQIADQNLGRAEKSEVLSEDLINAEKKVENLKQVCATTTKKLQALLQTSGSSSDSDKRLKKVPGYIIGSAFEENAGVLGEGILREIYSQSAVGHYMLSKLVGDYEKQTEDNLLKYLQDLLDNDIPSLQKTKKNLSKLTLDMDSARTRYAASQRQTAGAKVDSLKEEFDDAMTKMEQCKDQYATEVYTFIAKESEICEKIVEWLEFEALLHEKAAATLKDLVPKLKDEICRHSIKPLFGMPLEEHLSAAERDVAVVIETCIETLAQIAMDEEGLFRIAGSASKVKKLVAAFNAGTVDMAEHVSDVHAIAGTLKLYLRELPEPLLTFALNGEWLQTGQMKDRDQRMRHLWSTVQKLPKANFTNLRYLIKFLAKLAENSERNKMSPNNLAIVIGPNLLWAPEDGGPNVLSASIQSVIVELLVTNHAYFFPGDIDFTASAQEFSCAGDAPGFDATDGASVYSGDVSITTTGGTDHVPTISHRVTAVHSSPTFLARQKHKKPKEVSVAAAAASSSSSAAAPTGTEIPSIADGSITSSKGLGKLRQLLKGPADKHSRKSSLEYLEIGVTSSGHASSESVSLISMKTCRSPGDVKVTKASDELVSAVAEATVDLDSPSWTGGPRVLAASKEAEPECRDQTTERGSLESLSKKDSLLSLDTAASISSSANGAGFASTPLHLPPDTADFRTSPRISRAPSKKHAPPIPPRSEVAASHPATPSRPAPSRPPGPPPAAPLSGAAAVGTLSPPLSPATSLDAAFQPQLTAVAAAATTKAQQQQTSRAVPPRTELGPPPPPPARPSLESPPPPTASLPTAGSFGGLGEPTSWRPAGSGHVRTPSAGERPFPTPGHSRTPSGGDVSRQSSGGTDARVRPPIPERRGSRSAEHGAGDATEADVENEGEPDEPRGRLHERANSTNKETLL